LIVQVHEIVLASSDPDDLTLRQARLLGMADVVVHDGDVPETILARTRADALRLPRSATVPSEAQLVVVLRF